MTRIPPPVIPEGEFLREKLRMRCCGRGASFAASHGTGDHLGEKEEALRVWTAALLLRTERRRSAHSEKCELIVNIK